MTLGERLAECVARWGLEPGTRFERSFNHAYAAKRDGAPVVLKLGPGPADVELRREHSALCQMAGDGIVDVLEYDFELSALLLERAVPGTTLVGLTLEDDERATEVSLDVMSRLWTAVSGNGLFKPVERFGEDFAAHRCRFGGSGPLDPALFATAERLFGELAASSAGPTLLHGDLHHRNVLAASRAPWLAIDPKGTVGEPLFEVGALLRNPCPELLDMADPARVTRRRIDQMAERLAADRERIRGWGFAQAVLAAVWAVEDDDSGQEYWMACAELINQA